jgi:hypothetical protein
MSTIAYVTFRVEFPDDMTEEQVRETMSEVDYDLGTGHLVSTEMVEVEVA